MFDRLLSIFRKKGAKAPVKSDFLSPKEEPVKKPVVVLSDQKAPLPAVVQEKPPAILLPVMEKPVEEIKPLIPPVVQLPPDIDPTKVIVVRHDVKKTDGERFKYSDKPLKPLHDEGHGPELIKYNDQRSGDAIKYKAAPAEYKAAPAAPRKDAESRNGEVFKYTPSRVVIKS